MASPLTEGFVVFPSAVSLPREKRIKTKVKALSFVIFFPVLFS
jgi:hypothetical protein